ncbi:hypothetical protein PQG22_08980 [Aquirufa beregesia]
MSNIEKKKRELYILNFFKDKYVDFPSGKIEESERPDFIVNGENRLIGIEITEAIISPTELEKYKFQISITNDVLYELKDKLPFKFDIDIILKNNITISSKKKSKIISEIIELCLNECSNMKDLEIFQVQDFGANINTLPENYLKSIISKGYRNLPYGIHKISIGRCDSAKESWNNESYGMVLPNFTLEKLNRILLEKEKKLMDYAPCNEHWLLIWASRTPQSYYDKVEISDKVESKFDKIFFVQASKGIVEIFTYR